MKFPSFWLSILLLPSAVTQAATPPLEIAGLDVVSNQKKILLLNTAAKANILVFVSARCPCSASHEIALREISKEFSSQGFQFVGIHSNTDEPIEIAKSHFEKAALPFPVLQDASAKIANDWGALKTPHVFVVNPKGEILYQGGVDDSHDHKDAKKPYLREALLDIQVGKAPRVALTRSLGCAIKR